MSYVSELLAAIEAFGIPRSIVAKGFKSAIALCVCLLAWRLLARILSKNVKSPQKLYRYRKILNFAFYFAVAIVVGGVWFRGVSSIATFLGLISAGLAVALKEPLSNLVGWLYILWKEPFKVGHRVEIGEATGDVIDIGVFHFSMLEVGEMTNSEQHSGRILHVPNSQILNQVQANYDISFPFIWHEIEIVVTFESDWRSAKQLIAEVLKASSLVYDEKSLKNYRLNSKHFLLPDMNLDPTIYTSVADHGVRLSARFVCEPRNRRTIEQRVWEAVLDEFSVCNDIDFAYPTQRFFNHLKEGKGSLEIKGGGVE